MKESVETENHWRVRPLKGVATVFLISLGCYGAWGFALAGPKAFEAEADGVELLLNERYVERVLELIHASKKRVWVAMYVARYQRSRSYSIENKLFKALLKAHVRGVDVRVLLDEGYEWDAKSGKMSKRRSDKNEEALSYLLQQGIPVRLDDPERIMHAKTLCVDDRYAVVGSHNWTYSALSKNVEASVLLFDVDEVQALSKCFLESWNSGTEPR